MLHPSISFMLGCVLSVSALAQSGSDAIKIVVPFAAGGPADQIARIVATPLSAQLGKPVVIDNRGGAGGVIGVNAAAKSAPDGNTLLMTTISFVITAGITPNLPYNPRRDLEPLYLLGEVQTMLVVRPSLGVSNIAELIAKAKGPNKLNYGSTGTGGSMHIGAELFAKAAQVSMVHIPYKGAAPALVDLMGGTLDVLNADVPILQPYIKDGRLKGLVVYDTKRSNLLPDVPTSAEVGLTGMLFSNFYGMLLPAGTPPDTRKRLEAALAVVIKQPEVAAKLAQAGFINPRDSAGFAAKLQTEFDHWLPWLKEANIRAD